MEVKNAQGKVWYGLHFYPGVAEYREANSEPYRVFLNENTLRTMDPTFAGRPVFVQHVDEVEQNLDDLRKEADGWVVDSFYNEADGKHWVKFITVTDKAERAIRNGMRLSNCYIPKSFAKGGLWNGVTYAKEITGGEYEHLAIVPNPRYEESVIMTPEQFKKHNEDKKIELTKLSNERKDLPMKFKFFKKTKVENALDLEETMVVLPVTLREVTIAQLINEADKPAEEEKKDMNSGMADLSHKVKLADGSHCNVGELLEKHKALNDEMEAMKAKKEDGEDQDAEYAEAPAVGNEEEPKKEEEVKANDEDAEAKKKALELAEHEEKEIAEKKAKNAAEKAERLRNAPNMVVEAPRIDLSEDKVIRGQSRYGSK